MLSQLYHRNTISDNTIEAEGLGNFFETLGKEAAKNRVKKRLTIHLGH